jgi:DNA-binding SARP family transcriptional activator
VRCQVSRDGLAGETKILHTYTESLISGTSIELLQPRIGLISMRFAVLGPLEIADDSGEFLVVSQPRIRALLAVLLINANVTVNTGRMVSLLWGDDAPTGAIHAIHSYMSSARKVLLPHRPLQSIRPGYRLNLGQHHLDVTQFRSLSHLGISAFRDGDYSLAAKFLREASELWRDTSLPDFPETPAMKSVTHSLVEEFQVLRDTLYDARLAIGEHREVIPELRAATFGNPGNERTWLRLMLALYRSDMRTQSLDTFRQARSAIREESGLDPSPSMQRVHEQLLHDDPALWTIDILRPRVMP